MMEQLAPSRQEIVRQILAEPRTYVLLSLRTASRQLKVNAATLLRTVQAMGFKRYHDFQQYLHDRSIAFSTALDALESSEDGNSVEALIAKSIDRDIENLRSLRSTSTGRVWSTSPTSCMERGAFLCLQETFRAAWVCTLTITSAHWDLIPLRQSLPARSFTGFAT